MENYIYIPDMYNSNAFMCKCTIIYENGLSGVIFSPLSGDYGHYVIMNMKSDMQNK